MRGYEGYGSRVLGPRQWNGELRYGERLDDPEGYSDILLNAIKSRLKRLKAERMRLRQEGRVEQADKLSTTTIAYKKARYVYMNLPHRTFVNGHGNFKSFQGVWLCSPCAMFMCGVPIFGDEMSHASRMLRAGRVRKIDADAMLADLGRPWEGIPEEINGTFSVAEFNKRFHRRRNRRYG